MKVQKWKKNENDNKKFHTNYSEQQWPTTVTRRIHFVQKKNEMAPTTTKNAEWL